MWEKIVNLAISNGLWAVLFLGLFIFVIKDSAEREKKYQQTINDLTEHLGVVKDIKDDVDEIKNVVFKHKKSSKNAKNTQESTINKQKSKNYDGEHNTKVFNDIVNCEVAKIEKQI
jgi:preprotein translocase subunit YajC